MTKFYTASLSRTQGRGGYSVIFRHPTRQDPATGKPGRRFRRGLGTADEQEATGLVEQLNRLLSTPELWDPAARDRVAADYDERALDIFYDGMEASRLDFEAIRDEALVLPWREDGYRRVLLLGTTGAGKTTAVRQLLGTNPETERFPSTSTAKTTIADTEIVLTAEGTFRAVVTFVPRDEMVDHLAENAVRAALDVYDGREDMKILRGLLDHVNQRYRFSYVLGRGMLAESDDLDDDDDEDDEDALGPADALIDLDVTNDLLRQAVADLRTVVDTAAEGLLASIDMNDAEDERVAQELVEEALEHALRRSPEHSESFHSIIDVLSDEIEKRFQTLTEGELRRNRQGWPVSWTWETEDRAAFIRTIARFASNYAPLFGRLLTPLVNGIRVSGPFAPAWAADTPQLVLIDGEGLGHTPKSSANLSTSVTARLNTVDSILLVDNAAQPMQAAPTAAMKTITVSGHMEKLHFLFTHFDQVGGDNLPGFAARKQHVLASVENVLTAIGEDLGQHAEKALRKRVETASYFVGGIQERLAEDRKADRRTIAQLQAVVGALLTDPEKADTGAAIAVYDRMNLAMAVTAAADAFHTKWRALLGLDTSAAYDKEHWTRVKALSRRIAEDWAEEYDTLQPVFDLYYELQRQMYLMLQAPVRWESEPPEETQQLIVADISQAVTRKLIELVRARLITDRKGDWVRAYAEYGRGSTFVRAHIIGDDVFAHGAPIPGVVPSPDRNQFLRSVADLLAEVAAESEVMALD